MNTLLIFVCFFIFRKSKFEILLNENLSAKLEWRPYTKYSSVPEGAVSGVDSNSEEQGGNSIGYLDRLTDRLNRLPTGFYTRNAPKYAPK